MSTNNDISSLEVKITAEVANNNMTTNQETIVVMTTAVGQTESTGGNRRVRYKWSGCEWSECL
jgi:hypothetical protein